jgi:hypothetical protein
MVMVLLPVNTTAGGYTVAGRLKAACCGRRRDDALGLILFGPPRMKNASSA